MSFGIRRRLFLWLALVIVPVGAAIWVAVELVEHRLTERIEVDLESVRSLEAARLSGALEAYRSEASSLVADPGIGDLISTATSATAAGETGAMVVTPASRRRLNDLTKELLGNSRSAGGQVIAMRLVTRSGEVIAGSGGFSWRPQDPALIERALASGRPLFGEAFEIGSLEEVGIVAPVFNSSAVIVGALLLEMRLGPIVQPLTLHREFGETREAYLTQSSPSGGATIISSLRFDDDAAFRRVASDDGSPAALALVEPEGAVRNIDDYRGVRSVVALETIEETGWGLVIKVDRAEAFAPVSEVRRVVALSGLAAVLISLLGWLLLIRPLGRRLRHSARAAERVAAGDYRTPIGDTSLDEVGELARTIDRLASDLDADIQRRAVAEDSLRHRASHDDLTGLHNRQHTTEVIADLIYHGQGEDLSLLFLDLDRFKLINDTYGHAVGDEVLLAVGRRLAGAVDDTSTVARWGGDEFVVVLPGCDEERAAAIVERLREVFDEPVATSGGVISTYGSIGSATARPDSTVDSLLLEADAGMFTDKELGARGRSATGVALRTVSDALDEDRVEAWYQPIVTASGEEGPQLFGIEALARIRTPDGRVLMPADFLPAISDTQRAVTLDLRIARRALEDLARWRREDKVSADFRLALNLCARSVAHADFAGELTAVADEVGLGLEAVIIELPEDAVELDPAGLDALRATGVTLGIDDFGADYAHLDRLISTSAGVVKLDRGWLTSHGEAFAERERLVLSRLVEMCAELGMHLVAEGVETTAQYRLLLGLGVPHFQGFHFAHPQPADVLEGDWLNQRSSVPGR